MNFSPIVAAARMQRGGEIGGAAKEDANVVVVVRWRDAGQFLFPVRATALTQGWELTWSWIGEKQPDVEKATGVLAVQIGQKIGEPLQGPLIAVEPHEVDFVDLQRTRVAPTCGAAAGSAGSMQAVSRRCRLRSALLPSSERCHWPGAPYGPSMYTGT